MSAITDPWKCTICGKHRDRLNHWFLGFRNMGGYTFIAWLEEVASQLGVDHLCGYECLLKWCNRKAEEMIAREKVEVA